VGGGQDGRKRADHAVRGVQLRRPGGDPRRGRALPRRWRDGVPGAALRAGDARPGAADPHQRRAADLQLPPLAAGLQRAALHRRAVAGLLARGPRGRARHLCRAGAPLRRPLMGSDLLARVLVAIPAIAFAVFIIYEGGWVFAAGVGALGVVAVHELTVMLERAHPIRLAAMLSVIGLVVAGTGGNERQVLLAVVASVRVMFFLAVVSPRRDRVTAAMSATMLIIVWIGMGVAHAALLRGLNHGGALVFMVLLGTFIGDTAAYMGGRWI